MSTNDKIANLQKTLGAFVQAASDCNPYELRALKEGAAAFAGNADANLGLIVALATTMRCRAAEIERLALLAQSTQEALRGGRAATA